MLKRGRLSRLLPWLFGNEKQESKKDVAAGSECLILNLDDTECRVPFKISWKGQVLFDVVCDIVNIIEKDYFGLRFVDVSGQTHWMDHGKCLSSQLKCCSLPYKFYFCVKFYAADPCKLKEEITRYLFFLQVKRDILQGRLPVSFDEAAELCAYAVQSELGDFDTRHHTRGYVSELKFVPNQTEELEDQISLMHRRCLGATALMAELRFLDRCQWLEMYGVDLHPVQGEGDVEYFLGLTPTGVVVYKHKTKVASYFWPRVTKASHKSKIFMIKVKDKNNDESVYAFQLSSRVACKHLWKCCVEHQAFFSGRSKRQALSELEGRQQPSIKRVQSSRQQRRVRSDHKINEQAGNPERGLFVDQQQPVKVPRHRSLPELKGKGSPRSVKSAPWASNYDFGMYTYGHDGPEAWHQGGHYRSGSESESGFSHRKKYFPNRKESDNESDGSASRQRRRQLDSDSGSEISISHSSHTRKKVHKDYNRNNTPLYLFDEKDRNKKGSIPSLHSAPAGDMKQLHKRRRRSKSPSSSSSKQFPVELKEHIEYDLIDTEGMTEEQLQDIVYTRVETKNDAFRIKYSPRFRQKIWASRRKSFGSFERSRPSNPGFDPNDKNDIESNRQRHQSLPRQSHSSQPSSMKDYPLQSHQDPVQKNKFDNGTSYFNKSTATNDALNRPSVRGSDQNALRKSDPQGYSHPVQPSTNRGVNGLRSCENEPPTSSYNRPYTYRASNVSSYSTSTSTTNRGVNNSRSYKIEPPPSSYDRPYRVSNVSSYPTSTSTSMNPPGALLQQSSRSQFSYQQQTPSVKPHNPFYNNQQQTPSSKSHDQFYNNQQQTPSSKSHDQFYNNQQQTPSSKSHDQFYNNQQHTPSSKSHDQFYNNQQQTPSSKSHDQFYNNQQQTPSVTPYPNQQQAPLPRQSRGALPSQEKANTYTATTTGNAGSQASTAQMSGYTPHYQHRPQTQPEYECV